MQYVYSISMEKEVFMDEQEKNPGEMTPEVPAEEAAPQAADTQPEACSAPEQPVETPAGENEASGENETSGESTEADSEVPGKDAEEKEEETSDASAAEIKPGVKATPGKIALAVAFVVVLVAALIAVVVSSLGSKNAQTDPEETETVPSSETQQAEPTEETVEYTIPADGNPDDVTCKGSYTASDADVIAARDTVVATAGEHELTVGQLQV